MNAPVNLGGRPSAMIVGNYRSFPERTRMRLAPITLVYGWNNAGKSALLRMLALLGHSVRESASAPLDLSLFGSDADFRKLFWGGDPSCVEEEGLLVGLEWDDGGGPSGIEYLIDYSNEQRRSYVRAVRIQESPSSQQLCLEANRGEASLRRFKRVDALGADFVEIPFVGLVPPAGVGTLEGVRTRMLALRERIQWLKAVRAKPSQLIMSSGSVPRILAHDGNDAAQVLLTDDTVRNRVAGFYESACDRLLELKDVLKGYHSVFLPPKRTRQMNINLADTGEGMVQCLPVLVAGAMAERANGPRILVIEEPESHLHPRAQVALAKFLCEVATAPHRPAVVLETHSHALMLGVQLAIARGTIPAEDVCVYWLETGYQGETEMREVTFTAKGTPTSDDLLGVFAEESRIAQELSDIYVGG